MLKPRHALLLWLLALAGMPLMVFGALFKLPHWPSMELLGLIAGTLKFVAVTVLVQRVLRYPAFQDFLDK